VPSTLLASFGVSMMSISPDAAQPPYFPQPLHWGVDPSLGSIQKAGHMPVPVRDTPAAAG
jgi:hypothetical protein